MRKNSEFNKDYSKKPKRIVFLWIFGILLTVFGSILAPDTRAIKDDKFNERLSIEGIDFKFDNFLFDESKGMYQFDLNVYDTSAYVQTGDMEFSFKNKYGEKIDLDFYEHLETDLNANKKAVDHLVRTYQFKLDNTVGTTPEEMWFIFAFMHVTAPTFNVDTQTEEIKDVANVEVGLDYRLAEDSKLTDVSKLKKKISDEELKSISSFKTQVMQGVSPSSVSEEKSSVSSETDSSEIPSSEVVVEEDGITLEERNQKIDEELESLKEQLKQHQENIDNYNIVLETKTEIEDITKIQNLITSEENMINDINDRIEYLNNLKSEDTYESEV